MRKTIIAFMMILLLPTFMLGIKYEIPFAINKIAELPSIDFHAKRHGVKNDRQ